MKRIIALALFTLFCVITASAQSEPGPATSNSSSPAAWQTYELAKGNFTVLFPSKPSESISNDNGIGNYLYTVSHDGNLLLAGYSLLGEDTETWSGEANQRFYDGFWDGFSKAFEEKLKQLNLKLN